MTNSDMEIVVEDPDAPSDDSPAIATTRTVEIITMLVLMAFAALMAFDNWRTGISWAPDGPQAGYFPFYLSMIMLASALYGVGRALVQRHGEGSGEEVFVTRDQLRRVALVFVPTVAFCIATQWLGIYVASFLLVTGFMWLIGKIALWKSFVTGLVFSVLMFVTFQIAFEVIMPKGPLEALLGY
ncbi:tripartite tricarboxylate transporter TctB family protein [Afipia sp. TerB]